MIFALKYDVLFIIKAPKHLIITYDNLSFLFATPIL